MRKIPITGPIAAGMIERPRAIDVDDRVSRFPQYVEPVPWWAEPISDDPRFYGVLVYESIFCILAVLTVAALTFLLVTA